MDGSPAWGLGGELTVPRHNILACYGTLQGSGFGRIPDSNNNSNRFSAMFIYKVTLFISHPEQIYIHRTSVK
jgi:hypothetical protein